MAEVIVNDEELSKFCAEAFTKLGISKEDAEITSDNLVQADLRGIPSHGVARLMRYVNGIKSGKMLPNAKPKILKETPTTASVSGENGLGQPAGVFGMRLAIDKAKKTGVGFVTVCNSNHYGIAGYYSMMAIKDDLCGISMTNSAPLGVPTFSRDMIIGTNPISVVFPTAKERPWVLDMATTVVPRGKLEVMNRLGKPLPLGWAVDEKGIPTTDTKRVLDNMTKAAGGGVLPLGGAGEEFSGHKGYGMSSLVDIFSGVLSGAAYGGYVSTKKDPSQKFNNVGHFFGAIKIDNFIPLDNFKTTLDRMISELKNSSKAEGQDRVYIHGEKEFVKWENYKKNGVPLQDKVYDQLEKLSQEMNLKFDIKK